MLAVQGKMESGKTNNNPPFPKHEHNGWYSRGYLPHFDSSETCQFITFRLADSLPAHVLVRIRKEVENEEQMDGEKHKRIDRYLDAGHGPCFLRDPRIARVVEDALLYFDGERYRMMEWVVMPNHVHVLLAMFPGYPLAGILHSWRSFTANVANSILGRRGPFWAREYFDRYLRDEAHYRRTVNYIRRNPVKAGLVGAPEEWPFGSAARRDRK